MSRQTSPNFLTVQSDFMDNGVAQASLALQNNQFREANEILLAKINAAYAKVEQAGNVSIAHMKDGARQEYESAIEDARNTRLATMAAIGSTLLLLAWRRRLAGDRSHAPPQ